jgi:hypothetical protein
VSRGEPMPGNQTVYQDIVRLGERVLDSQFRMALDRFDRSDRLVRLGVATLAGMVVVLGFFLTQTKPTNMVGVAGIGLSILLVIVAIFILVQSVTRIHKDRFLSFGPDIRDLYDVVDEERLIGLDYHRFVARHIPVHIEVNMEVIQALSARQGQAILLFGLGVVIHLVAISYIAGGVIFG